jgi:hypothetical protein
VNCTDNGALPFVILLVKLAVGTSAALTAPVAEIQKTKAKIMSKIELLLFLNI